jgi:hypothetical protein
MTAADGSDAKSSPTHPTGRKYARLDPSRLAVAQTRDRPHGNGWFGGEDSAITHSASRRATHEISESLRTVGWGRRR